MILLNYIQLEEMDRRDKATKWVKCIAFRFKKRKKKRKNGFMHQEKKCVHGPKGVCHIENDIKVDCSDHD